jgi:5-methylcytosine-specific restriction endonuclease McrA
MTKHKYTEAELSAAVAQSISIAGVMRLLGIKPAGGSHFHMSKRISKSGLDTSHFTGQGHNRGKTLPNQRKKPEEILVLNSAASARTRSQLLRRALAEIGEPLICGACGIGDRWLDQPLTLHVDHINGKSHDCRRENLRFLCPNCHSQTASYCRKLSARRARDEAT